MPIVDHIEVSSSRRLKVYKAAWHGVKGHVALIVHTRRMKQAGAELGQAQLKLGLDFSLILCRIGFSRFGLVELV